MRSRYTAYATGDVDYIGRTCAAEERKTFDRNEALSVVAEITWQGLQITRVEAGGPKDETGLVDFVFCFTQNDQPHVQREIASFVRENGAWVYQSSEVNPKTEPTRVDKAGRNDPCTCGSGKKYKKCCGG